MANEQNFPNGWKDGYSSADHATESYSPYAAERKQREALGRSEERERRMSEYNSGLAREQARYEKQQSERAKVEWQNVEREREARRHISQRREAINIIVQQKREDYNKKSWFQKAIAKLRGRTFNKMKSQITAEAERRVDKMSPAQIERFIENQHEQEGRRR